MHHDDTTSPHPHFALETAGGLMTDKVPVIHEDATIEEVEKMLITDAATHESIHYVYLLGSNKTLKGVMSLKEVFRSPKSVPAKQFVHKDMVSVRPHTDQERVAYLALTHNLKSLPVVDKDDHFLGAVTDDMILRILDTESVEDILRFGGVMHAGRYDNVLNIPIFRSIKHRLPWLILGLVGGMLGAGIVNQFEGLLSRYLILASFIPLIVYMADAVGTQMEAFIIRDLAVNPKLKFFAYFWRQASIVVLIGILASALLFLGAEMIFHNFVISLVLGIALFLAILTSLVTGLIVPYLFGKLRLDPANASGPIATIIQDILSVLVYFSVATWLL